MGMRTIRRLAKWRPSQGGTIKHREEEEKAGGYYRGAVNVGPKQLSSL